jgi:hypothetical protein
LGAAARILESIDLSKIQDEGARLCILGLLNLHEQVMEALRQSQEENQRLRDEIARLKGEQGKPEVKANTPKPPPPSSTDYSSEKERHIPKERAKGSKVDKVHIDREQPLSIDRATLPPDAEFKGHEGVTVQDVIFRTDNVLFRKEKYYSQAEGKAYLAPLPPGYDGEFGPGIKALTLTLYFGVGTSEPKIAELFRNQGIMISDGQLSNLLIKGKESFHAEKEALLEAGLASSSWQHLDQTGTRVNGVNRHCQIVCNPLYTAYRTTETKDRMSVLDTLRNGRPRLYLLNKEAEGYLARTQMSKVAVNLLKAGMPPDRLVDEPAMKALLAGPLSKLGPQQQRWALDATAVAAYHAETGFPVVRMLLCDGAPQFTWVTEELSLCWVHEGRHYKKLTPWVPLHRQLLEEYLKQFWGYYRELLAYQAAPSPVEAERLSARFDELFGTVTGYLLLDDRIAKTRDKKGSLLLVLSHPEIPLHNNPAELGARARVRKRDVSFGPRTADGSKAWDTFMSLAETAKKLGISFHDYVHDRISHSNRIPRLNAVIDARAEELNLAPSWNTS